MGDLERRLVMGPSRVLGSVIVATAVVPMASATPPRSGAFETPSRNIVCQSFGDGGAGAGIECGIRTGLVGARVVRCGPGDPVTDRVRLLDRGRASRVLCAGDPGPLDRSVRPFVLRYGRMWGAGQISCLSSRSGLTCHNHYRHGFFLSRTRWRLF